MQWLFSFENYKFNYFTGGPLVLKGLSLSISPGEKIGIGMLCRRTMNHRLWSIVYESYSMTRVIRRFHKSNKSWKNWCRKKQSALSIVSNQQRNIWRAICWWNANKYHTFETTSPENIYHTTRSSYILGWCPRQFRFPI